MFLAIDVGNTQTTLGLFDADGALVKGWRMASEATDTSDMLHARLYTYFLKDGFGLADVTCGAIASVVPPLQRAWWVCLRELLGKDPLSARPRRRPLTQNEMAAESTGSQPSPCERSVRTP